MKPDEALKAAREAVAAWPNRAELRFGFRGLGLRVWGLGFGVWGLGFRVEGFRDLGV